MSNFLELLPLVSFILIIALTIMAIICWQAFAAYNEELRICLLVISAWLIITNANLMSLKAELKTANKLMVATKETL